MESIEISWNASFKVPSPHRYECISALKVIKKGAGVCQKSRFLTINRTVPELKYESEFKKFWQEDPDTEFLIIQAIKQCFCWLQDGIKSRPS